MRTSHIEVRKRIEEEKSRITDEEFFTSAEYQAYLTDKTEAAGRRYSRPVRVTVYADGEDETVACTDYRGIFINASNRITRSFPTRKLRAVSIDGLRSHEQGHILFTDSRVWKTHLRKLSRGRFYPRKPSGLDAAHKQYAADLLAALTDETDPVPRAVVLQTAGALENILEDGYVDTRMSAAFPGSPARGIALNNIRFAETVPDIGEMVGRGYEDHNIVLNLLIQYVRAGEVNNLSGYRGEFLDAVTRYIPLVDGCLLADDARDRCGCVNRILVDLWPFMERCFDELRSRYRTAPPQSGAGDGTGEAGDGAGTDGSGADGESGDSSGGEAEASSGKEDESSLKAAAEAVEKELGSQLPAAAPNFQVSTSAVPPDSSSAPVPGQMSGIRGEAGRVLAEETERIAAHTTEEIVSSGDGTAETDRQYEGSGYTRAAEDIERLLDSMAEHKVSTRLEEELSEELQREALDIRYGDAHRGISVTVHRMARVDRSLIEAYDRAAPELIPISRRLQNRVRPLIRDKRQGGKLTGLYYGRRLDQKALGRLDGRCFCSTRLPSEPLSIRVAMVNDESGSMCGSDRITRARAAAVILYDFCSALGIPIMIIGHTAWNSHVEIFSYSDFGSVDRMDRYRIMDMSARDCNRDGAAVRFAAERLDRETADVKLMFILSDGQPNDDGYSGSAAEADLRGIKREYTRKGIRIYAAAIGDDRENIERIYGDGFLDITDLRDLPVLLTGIITRSLPL